MNNNKQNNECPLRATSRPAWPSKDELPIVAFAPIPYSYQESLDKQVHPEALENIYQSVSESGCNAVIIGLSGDATEYQMPAAKRHNVKVIFPVSGTWGIESHCFDLLRKYIGNSDIAAWFSYDEPKPYQWGDAFYSLYKKIDMGDSTYWNQLTTAYGISSSLDQTRISIFNLIAESNTDWAGSFGIDYKDKNLAEKLDAARHYLNNLQTLFRPWIWSYDYYPIKDKVEHGSIVIGGTKTDYEKFYGYLGLYQDFTKKIGSEFWAYGMCMAHEFYEDKTWTKLKDSFPTPTEGSLRFEVFSALLYGAQGIVYYRYGLGISAAEAADPDKKGVVGNTKCVLAPLSCEVEKNSENAIINVTIHKSIIWERLKKVNGEIKAFQKIFLRCNVKGHRQYPYSNGATTNIETIKRYEGDISDIDECIEIAKCYGYGVLLTSLTNSQSNGKLRHYVAIMNLDPLSTICTEAGIPTIHWPQVMSTATDRWNVTSLARGLTPKLLSGKTKSGMRSDRSTRKSIHGNSSSPARRFWNVS